MSRTEVIETTAEEVAAELPGRRIGPDDRVTITTELEQELSPGRRESRPRGIAAGPIDDDIGRLIGQAQGSRTAAMVETNRRSDPNALLEVIAFAAIK